MKKEYQNHIDVLSKELGCEVRQSPELPGMMYVEFGYIEGPKAGLPKLIKSFILRTVS